MTICPFEDLRDDQATYELAQELVRDIESLLPGSRDLFDLMTLGWAACRCGHWQEALQAFDAVNAGRSVFQNRRWNV